MGQNTLVIPGASQWQAATVKPSKVTALSSDKRSSSCAYVCGEITESWMPEEQELPAFISLCFRVPTSQPAPNPEGSEEEEDKKLSKVFGAHEEVESHRFRRNPGSKQGKSRKKLWKVMSPPSHHPVCETVHKTNVFVHTSYFIPVYYLQQVENNIQKNNINGKQ